LLIDIVREMRHCDGKAARVGFWNGGWLFGLRRAGVFRGRLSDDDLVDRGHFFRYFSCSLSTDCLVELIP
jgi:hypothetical protein